MYLYLYVYLYLYLYLDLCLNLELYLDLELDLDMDLNIGRFMCPPVTPNAFLGDLCASRPHFEHPKLENTVIYQGKSQNRQL